MGRLWLLLSFAEPPELLLKFPCMVSRTGVKMGGAEDELCAACPALSGLHVQQLRKIIVTQSLVTAAVVIL